MSVLEVDWQKNFKMYFLIQLMQISFLLLLNDRQHVLKKIVCYMTVSQCKVSWLCDEFLSMCRGAWCVLNLSFVQEDTQYLNIT